MKTKYQRMNKEEKTKIREKFKNSEHGKEQMPRLNRLLFLGVLGIGAGTYLIIDNIMNAKNIWMYITNGILIIASIIFFIGSLVLRQKEYNKVAIKEK